MPWDTTVDKLKSARTASWATSQKIAFPFLLVSGYEDSWQTERLDVSFTAVSYEKLTGWKGLLLITFVSILMLCLVRIRRQLFRTCQIHAGTGANRKRTCLLRLSSHYSQLLGGCIWQLPKKLLPCAHGRTFAIFQSMRSVTGQIYATIKNHVLRYAAIWRVALFA